MAPFLSKPEVKQYLMKLYNLDVKRVNTVLKQGKILRHNDKPGYYRKDDWKKAIVKVDFSVNPDLQKID